MKKLYMEGLALFAVACGSPEDTPSGGRIGQELRSVPDTALITSCSLAESRSDYVAECKTEAKRARQTLVELQDPAVYAELCGYAVEMDIFGLGLWFFDAPDERWAHAGELEPVFDEIYWDKMRAELRQLYASGRLTARWSEVDPACAKYN